MNHRMITIVAAAFLFVAPAPAFAAFRCPVADENAPGETLNLSMRDMTESTGVESEHLRAAVKQMQANGLKSGQIVDRLVVAYCGRIANEGGVSDEEKASQVRRFASRLVAYLYSAPGASEEDIMVDVSIPTPLYRRLQEAAKTVGLSEDAWVKQAITTHLSSTD